VTIEYTAALSYSWSIPYIVNRAPVTLLCSRSIFVSPKSAKTHTKNMSAPEDQTPKASGSHQPYNPLQFTPIAPKAITERPHLEASHSESELEPDSVMADILSRRAQSYEPQADDSPDPLTFPLGLMHRLGAPRVRNPPGSTTSSRQRVDTREYRLRRPALSQEQCEDLLATII